MTAEGCSLEEVEQLAASAWAFRWSVELEARARFARLAGRLRSIGAPASIVATAERAARDEDRHAGLCAGLARELGATLPAAPAAAPREIAPPSLDERGRVLYEVVAACCITETESMGVLTTLLEHARGGALRRVLRELAADEVRHSQLGWAHLAAEQEQGATAFLSPLVPAMLQGNAAPGLFAPAGEAAEDARLLEHGVLPHATKRAVFVETLEAVVFPGLARFGVDPGPARAWLEERRGAPRPRAAVE